MTRRRRARDPEIGKNYIVEDMDYKEWYQKCVVDKYGEQKAETFQKMIRNKASDRKQYERYREILGKDAPKSFTDFRELKYNDSQGWNNLKQAYKEQNVRNYIKSDEVAKTILEGKHIIGHNNYIEGRSYLTISMEEAQELVNKYAGTGELLFANDGKWRNQEVIATDRVIGYNISDIDGSEVETKDFKIHYSKKGTHIVPK